MSLAVFLLPKDDFAMELVQWKEKIEKQYPNQLYTVHPPHMTLINMEVKNEEEGVTALSTLSGSIHPFEIIVNRTDIFWGDIATDGHTLFFGIEKNDFLHKLQITLANVLMSVKKNVMPPDYLTGNKELLRSYDRYGFPFVGDHWVPHFSVSSLQIEMTDPLIEEFLSLNRLYRFTVDQLTLWRINGDKHTQLVALDFQ